MFCIETALSVLRHYGGLVGVALCLLALLVAVDPTVQLGAVIAGLIFLSFEAFSKKREVRTQRAVADAVAAVEPRVPNAQSPETTINIAALPDALIITRTSGEFVAMNTLAETLLGPSETSENERIDQRFDRLHQQAVNPHEAQQVVAAILSAPGLTYTDTLDLTDGRTIERNTQVMPGTQDRLWLLRDISQLRRAARDHEMHQSLAEDETARMAELAEQLFLAKQELERNQAELTRLANTDPLTGLFNRRRFMDVADEKLQARCQSDAQQSISWVLMFDIDHFKLVNDTYGHAGGDLAIKEFGHILTDALGGAGYAARLGGEEFAVLMTDATMDEALDFAEIVRETTEDHCIDFDQKKIRFTVSVGAAHVVHGEETVEPALDRADSGLYCAKALGRNRVEVHGVAAVEAKAAIDTAVT